MFLRFWTVFILKFKDTGINSNDVLSPKWHMKCRYCRPVGKTWGVHPWKHFLRARNVAYGLFQIQFFTLTKPQFPYLLTHTQTPHYMGLYGTRTHFGMREWQWHGSTSKGNSLTINKADWILILINHLKSNREIANIFRMKDWLSFDLLELKLHTITTLLEECQNRPLSLIAKWHAPKQEG